jgi:hypothetical protein
VSRIPSSFDLVLDHDVSLDGDTIVDPGSVGPKAQVASVKRAQTMLPPRPRSSKAPEPAKPSTRRPSLRFEADLAEKTELMALPVASAKSQVSPPRAPTSHEPRDTKGSTQRMHVSQLVAARRASTASVPAIAVEAFRASSPSFPLPQRPSQPADSLAPVASPLVPVASDSLSAVVGANDESWSVRPEYLGTRSPFAKKAWAAGAIACALGFLGLLATAGGKPTSSSMASQPTALSTSVVSSPSVPSAKAPSLADVVDSRLAAPSSKPDFELEETPSPVKPAAAARASKPVVQAPVVDARAKTESKAEKASKPEASTKQGKGTARGTAKGEDAEAAGAARIHAEANTAIADTL